jgi:hypothetical protein
MNVWMEPTQKHGSGQHTVDGWGLVGTEPCGLMGAPSSVKVLSTNVFALQHMWPAHQECYYVDHGYGSCAGAGNWLCLW